MSMKAPQPTHPDNKLLKVHKQPRVFTLAKTMSECSTFHVPSHGGMTKKRGLNEISGGHEESEYGPSKYMKLDPAGELQLAELKF